MFSNYTRYNRRKNLYFQFNALTIVVVPINKIIKLIIFFYSLVHQLNTPNIYQVYPYKKLRFIFEISFTSFHLYVHLGAVHKLLFFLTFINYFSRLKFLINF